MKSKIKLFKAVLKLFSVVAVIIYAFSMVAINLSEKTAKANAISSYGISASVKANYYVGKNSYKMMSGDLDELIFEKGAEETCKALEPIGDIELSSSNSYIIFEYIFENLSNEDSFALVHSMNAETNNMSVSCAFSNEQISDFDSLSFGENYFAAAPKQSGYKIYYYIKAQIDDLNKGANLSGLFGFSMISSNVCKVTFIDGDKISTQYVAEGYNLSSQKINNVEGKQFAGYFTMPNGEGEKIVDENGFSQYEFGENEDLTLYSYYINI